MQSNIVDMQSKTSLSSECSKQVSDTEYLREAAKQNATQLAEGIAKTFTNSRATHVSMRKEDVIEAVTHAYMAGANAVIDYYEGE